MDSSYITWSDLKLSQVIALPGSSVAVRAGRFSLMFGAGSSCLYFLQLGLGPSTCKTCFTMCCAPPWRWSSYNSVLVQDLLAGVSTPAQWHSWRRLRHSNTFFSVPHKLPLESDPFPFESDPLRGRWGCLCIALAAQNERELTWCAVTPCKV